MQSRYALRFDTGERKGEKVALSNAGVTVGRKPGNSVQLLDSSVSGRHAEFVLDGARVLLRDLGSTNGTKVGGVRVSERALEHGDQILLGNVGATFLDLERPEPAAAAPRGAGGDGAGSDGAESDEIDLEAPDVATRASAPRAAAPERESSDAVRTISADKVARSNKLSWVGLVGLLAAAGIGGGGWWWINSQQASSGASSVREVSATPGNLLGASFSFEDLALDGEDSPWNNDAGAAAVFSVEGGSRYSGVDGLGALLSGGQAALARSKALPLSGAKGFSLAAQVRTSGGAAARVGLEFESSTDAAARTSAWSAPLTGAEEFQPLEWTCAVPAGFDRVSVLLAARAGAGEGRVDVDDVVLLSRPESSGALALDSFQFVPLGAPATAAVLFKIERTLLSDLHVREADGERAALAVSTSDVGFALALGEGGGRVLSVRADGVLTTSAPATLGEGGFRTHESSFERDNVTRVVLGAGKDLVALRFEAPVRVTSRAEGAGLRLEVQLGAARAVSVQTSFKAEREAALALAREAREADRKSEYGAAIALWNRLRDEAPFDSELLGEADAGRARLAELGLAELRTLRAELERARFFRLVELYRQSRAQAQSIAQRFAGGEIEAGARAIFDEIALELDALEADLKRHERARLQSIAAALAASNSERLAQRVREVLEQRSAAAGAQGGGR